ncbi:Fur family transcriptional regulator [Candidatus Omnitrophota bacterium]
MASAPGVIFEHFLREKDLRLTYQRKKILDIFLKTEKHLSVEDLYDIVKKKDKRIGQTTVFRTLKLLCQAGIAQEVDLGEKMIRYEHKHGHPHHDHLICVRCGACIETVDSRIERLQEELCRKYKFTPQKNRMEIFGLCSRCAKNSRS